MDLVLWLSSPLALPSFFQITKDQIHDSIIPSHIYSSLFRMLWNFFFFFKAKPGMFVDNEADFTQFLLWSGVRTRA